VDLVHCSDVTAGFDATLAAQPALRLVFVVSTLRESARAWTTDSWTGDSPRVRCPGWARLYARLAAQVLPPRNKAEGDGSVVSGLTVAPVPCTGLQ